MKRVTAEAGLDQRKHAPPTKKRVITSARREQNKLSQRAYRQRQKELKKQLLKPIPGPRTLEPRPNSDNRSRLFEYYTSDTAESDAASESSTSSRSPSVSPSLVTGLNPLGFLPTEIVDSSNIGEPLAEGVDLQITSDEPLDLPARHADEPNTSSSVERVDKYLSIGRSLEDNRTAVLRACLTNALCIGMDIAELMFCETPYRSPFYQPIAGAGASIATVMSSLDSRYLSLPVSLKPTWAQIVIPHHASLDLIPLPKLRERAILASAAVPHIFSGWEVKLDIYTRDALLFCPVPGTGPGRSLSSDYSPTSQPWDRSSWRVAPWFLKKWKMVLEVEEPNVTGKDYDHGHTSDDAVEMEDFANTGIPGLWM
ncbi:hypothetical protein F5Y17DRAFT_322944 [Xylariaceae sp. FL0594]|nr:hypothetical protein F5Y17DRAFT_322944 [Xylariaceae sp. FL0594]